MLLIFILVELKKSLSKQEGKLAQQHKEYLVKKQTTTDFSLLNIVIHNINSLKANSYKLDLLVE